MACNDCLTKCKVIDNDCLFNGDTYLSSGMDAAKIEASIKRAQNNWLAPILADCWEDFCEALVELADNGTPLPDKWAAVKERATELIVYATEYQFLLRGRVTVGSKGDVTLPEIKDWPEFIKGLRSEVSSIQQEFVRWIKAEHSKNNTYPCLEDECGETMEEELPFVNSWSIVGGNPSIRRNMPDLDTM